MDSFLRRLFVSEIQHQCQFALTAYNDITTGLTAHDNIRLFYSTQGFLIACANISKIFWPQSAQYTQRGDELKLLLSIDDSSPLKRTGARNHLEHFDERLDIWYTQSKHHNVMDLSVGGTQGPVAGQIDFMRYFDNQKFAFKFRSDVFELAPLKTAIEDLLIKANNELSERPPKS